MKKLYEVIEKIFCSIWFPAVLLVIYVPGTVLSCLDVWEDDGEFHIASLGFLIGFLVSLLIDNIAYRLRGKINAI